MPEPEIQEFNALCPPVIAQPTFTPPVSDVFPPVPPLPPAAPVSAPLPGAGFAGVDDSAAVPPAKRSVVTKTRVVAGLAVVAILGLGIGTVTQVARAGRLDKDLRSTRADLSAKTTEAQSLRSQVTGLEDDKADLTDRNQSLVEFGATVSSLVSDLNSCVDGMNGFISDLADNLFWSSAEIRNLVSECGDAQTKAKALDSALTS